MFLVSVIKLWTLFICSYIQSVINMTIDQIIESKLLYIDILFASKINSKLKYVRLHKIALGIITIWTCIKVIFPSSIFLFTTINDNFRWANSIHLIVAPIWFKYICSQDGRFLYELWIRKICDLEDKIGLTFSVCVCVSEIGS